MSSIDKSFRNESPIVCLKKIHANITKALDEWVLDPIRELLVIEENDGFAETLAKYPRLMKPYVLEKNLLLLLY